MNRIILMNSILFWSACLLLITMLPLLFVDGDAFAKEAGEFRAGAAKVNITPPEDGAFQLFGYGGRTEGFTGIRDSLYYRTIVVDDGTRQAALVVGDILATTDYMWQQLSERIEQETGIESKHLLLAATHTHGAPGLFRDGAVEGDLAAYTDEVADKIVKSVKKAQEALVPARMGVDRGYANVNVNRIARTDSGSYWLGQNPDGPSDKTVHVVKFEDLDGNPIAILVNYAVHAVVAGSRNLMVTADLPGVTSRMVEKHYGDNIVVPWTSGAAGDQNPIYAVLDDPDGGLQLYGSPMDVQGQILSDEVIRVADNMGRMISRIGIQGEQKVVTVPGKEQNRYSPTADYTFVKADPLDVRLSMLRIGPVAFGGVSGEVLTRIGKRFKAESPFSESIMITHTNGSIGYLPDDKAYERPGYEITVTRAKEGAESAIVNGLIELMEGF